MEKKLEKDQQNSLCFLFGGPLFRLKATYFLIYSGKKPIHASNSQVLTNTDQIWCLFTSLVFHKCLHGATTDENC